jgi:hypothetical protein
LTPSIILLFPPSPHSWNSFNRSHSSIYIHVYTVFAPYSPSFTLSPPPLPSHWYQTLLSGRTWSTLLFSDFVKEKNKIKFLLKITTQEFSLWHFHVCMYYSPIWFISSIFLLSTLVPFLVVWWIWLMYSLYKNEYRIFKLVESTILFYFSHIGV